MSGEKVIENGKILQVMEKCRDYFKEWDADMTFGINSKNVFYMLASSDKK